MNGFAVGDIRNRVLEKWRNPLIELKNEIML
jgi:hypothetical protein